MKVFGFYFFHYYFILLTTPRIKLHGAARWDGDGTGKQVERLAKEDRNRGETGLLIAVERGEPERSIFLGRE